MKKRYKCLGLLITSILIVLISVGFASAICTDGDLDGYGVCPNCDIINGCTFDGDDCDDGNIAINPGAAEVCNDLTNTDDDCDGNANCLDSDCFGIAGPNGDNCCNDPSLNCAQDDCVIETCDTGGDNECLYANRAQCDATECLAGRYCHITGGNCVNPDANSQNGETTCEACIINGQHTFGEGWTFEAGTPQCCEDDVNEYYIIGNDASVSCCNTANECVIANTCMNYAWTEGVTEVTCNDGIDNDCDNLIDCLDPDCFGIAGPGGDECCNNPAVDCTQYDCVTEACNGGTNECDYSGIRVLDDNTEVTTTCYHCDGVNLASQPDTAETGINCVADCYDCVAGSCNAVTENNDNGCADDCDSCIAGTCTLRAVCDNTECAADAACNAAGGNCASPDTDAVVCTTNSPGCYNSVFDAGVIYEAGNNDCCGDDLNEYYIIGNDASAACCNMANECVIAGNCMNYAHTEGVIEVTCNDAIDNDCDGLADCLDPDCTGSIGPLGSECCLVANDCPGADAACKRCTVNNECNPRPTTFVCNAAIQCSGSPGGDDFYNAADFTMPSTGYCDGAGSCDYSSLVAPTCDLAESTATEGTGLTICVDGQVACVDTCTDLADNDLDGCIDGPGADTDVDCGGTEATCNDGIDNDCDGLQDCNDPDCATQLGPGGVTCCQAATDCPGADLSCKSCVADICAPLSTATLCDANYLCSGSPGGDDFYNAADFTIPSQGYCDGAGSCDYSSNAPLCNLAEATATEGTGLTICVDGNAACIDTCADLLDNDADGCFDAVDSNCGGVDMTCDNIDDDCDGIADDDYINVACGSGVCSGTTACIAGVESCSTTNADCGICCLCENDNNPAPLYDPTQVADCAVYDCDPLDTTCAGYTDVQYCKAIGDCADANEDCNVVAYSPTTTVCDTNWRCSNTPGGDNAYGSFDYLRPSRGYCDGTGNCDQSNTARPVCILANGTATEGTGLTICVNGVNTCVNTCTDLADNDLDGCIDANDVDCGGTELVCNDGIDNDCDGNKDCNDPDCYGAIGPFGNECCNDPLTDCTLDDCVIESCSGVTGECSYTNRAQCDATECGAGQYCHAAGGNCVNPDANNQNGEDTCEACIINGQHTFGEAWIFEAGTPQCCEDDANEYYITGNDASVSCCNTANECVIANTCMNYAWTEGTIEVSCADTIDNDCDGLADCLDPDCVNANAIGPGGAECCAVADDCPGDSAACKSCGGANECVFAVITTQCNASWRCSNTPGGDNAYGSFDYLRPSRGYCDGTGNCDQSNTARPVCILANGTATEGTGLTICVDGINTCADTCADGLDNDLDGCTDLNAQAFGVKGPDSNCAGAIETECADLVDNDCDSLIDFADTDCFALLIVINEVELENRDTPREWVELYNPTNISHDISGWELMDASTFDNITIDPGTTINAYGYYVIVRPQYTTTFSNSGDNFTLRNAVGTIIDRTPTFVDETSYNDKKSWSRVPNGADTNDLSQFSNKDWLFQMSTRGTTNDDQDLDGFLNAKFGVGDDCDDRRYSIRPNATEVIYDGLDNDCNTSTLDDDMDQDGYDSDINIGGTDCDDNDPNVNPGAAEIDNDIDDDCDNIIDKGFENIVILSPLNQYYGDDDILLNIDTGGQMKILKYAKDGGTYAILCRDCLTYSAVKSFSEGHNSITVKGTDYNNNDHYASVEFDVDSRKPLMYSQTPYDDNYAKGTFTVTYTEDYLKRVELYWKDSEAAEFNVEELTGCPSGTRVQCSATIDISGSNNGYVDYYFNVSNTFNSAKLNIYRVIVDTENPVLTINQPQNTNYSERRVPFDITINDDNFEELEYSDNGGEFRTLCSDCEGYVRTKSFRDGNHIVVIRATDKAGNIEEETVIFGVDSKKPRINRQYPSNRRYTNGTFEVVYTEENLQDISVYYKGIAEPTYNKQTKSSPDCPSGRSVSCTLDVDLSPYEDQEIIYYIEIRDYLQKTVSRRNYTETVDTVKPIITINTPVQGQTYDNSIVFDIDLSEKVKYLKYSDNNNPYRSFCAGCYGYNNRRRTFRDGPHTLDIMAIDYAGNVGEETISFDVN